MPQLNVQPKRADPFRGFRFRLTWEGRAVAGVSRISALRRSTEVIEHFDGGEPSRSRKVPGRTKYEAVTVERSLAHDVEFEDWANRVSAPPGGGAAPAELRKDVLIEVFDAVGQRVAAYRLLRCWVSSFQALSALDAETDLTIVQSLTLENEGWVRETTAPTAVGPG